MASFRRSRVTEKVIRLLQTLRSHWARAARAITTRISRMMVQTPERSTWPGPIIRSMASPQSRGIYSWAATLTAATTRLAPTKKP